MFKDTLSRPVTKSVTEENSLSVYYSNLLIFGAGKRIRTSDLLITNQLLYQLSYSGTVGAEV